MVVLDSQWRYTTDRYQREAYTDPHKNPLINGPTVATH